MNSLFSLIQFCGNPASLLGWFWGFGSHLLRVTHSSRHPHQRLGSGSHLLPRQRSLPRSTAWFAPTLLYLFLANVGASEPAPNQHRNAFKIAIDAMPVRLEGISTKLDWGLNETCQLKLQLLNQSQELWKTVVADGGCTCLKIAIDEIPKTGVKPGEFLVANVVYSKPKESGVTPRSIRFSINDTPAVLPVIVDWHAPVELQKLEQVKPNQWQLEGVCGDGWTLDSVDVVDDDIDVLSQKTEGRSFFVHLMSTLKIDRTTRLLCKVSSIDEEKSVEQVLKIVLENDEPRSIPNRLICHVNKEGILTGDTRLVFPRARQTSRPNLDLSFLLSSDGKTVPLVVTHSDLGKIALRVHFSSESRVDTAILRESSTIRFLFDDDSQLDCHFLVSAE